MTTRQARINEERTPVSLTVATFVSTNGDGTCQVDFGEGEIAVTPVGLFHRTPGEPVTVLTVNGFSIIIGPAVTLPSAGIVTSVGVNTMKVNTALEEDVELAWVGMAPVVSDEVAIINGWGLVDPSRPPSSDYSGPGAPDTGSRTLEFTATDSGSWNGSNWWTNELWASDSNKGAWFYGTTIGDSISDTATITKVEVFVPEFYSGPGGLAAIGTHGLVSKSGAPTISGASAVDGGAGWRTLPNSIGDTLKTGAGRGLGYQQASPGVGFRKVSARTADADSGKLRITFTG